VGEPERSAGERDAGLDGELGCCAECGGWVDSMALCTEDASHDTMHDICPRCGPHCPMCRGADDAADCPLCAEDCPRCGDTGIVLVPGRRDG
jgi:hypothetical protein